MNNPPRQPSPVETVEETSDVGRDLTGGPARPDRPAGAETLRLLSETLEISKQAVLAGTVRVSTRTESFEEIAEVALDRSVVDVTHVAVGRIVEVAPTIRTEGDTTIVPVIEERFVVVKQLYLREELHIRHSVETEVSQVPVTLRRQTAVVEQLDAEGRVLPSGAAPRV